MQRLMLAILLVLGGYTTGTIVVSPRLPEGGEVASEISPFLLVAFGVLIVSVGYSLAQVMRVFRKEGRDEDS